ncbi:MAG: ribosomal protein S18-alanine N-acetyltransferase [Candidatus Methanospirareceae archaeon]
MLIIRNLKKRDFERVMEIERAGALDGDPYLYMEIYESYPEGFLVAEYEGVVVGFVIVVLTPEGEGRIFAIAVDPRYRGRGIGRELLKAAFDVLKKRNIRSVRLEVRRTNFVAQHLYKSLGFVPFGFIPSYYKDGEDAILMRKILE